MSARYHKNCIHVSPNPGCGWPLPKLHIPSLSGQEVFSSSKLTAPLFWATMPWKPPLSAWHMWNQHSCSTLLLLTRHRKQFGTEQEMLCRLYPKLPKAAHFLPRHPVTVLCMHSYHNFSQQLSMLTKMPSVPKSQTRTVVLTKSKPAGSVSTDKPTRHLENMDKSMKPSKAPG